MWCVRFIQRTCEPVRRQKCFLLEWSSRSAHEEMEFFWGLFVLVVMKVGVDVAIKCWEGKAGGFQFALACAWLKLGLCCGGVSVLCGSGQDHLRHTCTPSSFQPWQFGPTSPARRGTNHAAKNLPNIWD